jgi:hypothetical protein
VVGLMAVSPARAECPGPKNCPKPPSELAKSIILPTASIEITEPSGPIREHMPIEILYSVALKPSAVGGAKPYVDLVVCEDDGNDGIGPCDVYDHVRANWSTPGGARLQLNAPPAGAAVTMRVLVCTKQSDGIHIYCGVPLDSKTFQRPISARYTVSLDSFTVLSTRSRYHDTDYLTLQAVWIKEHQELLDNCSNIRGQPTIENPILCKGPVKYGTSDVGHGTFPVSNMTVGEFEAVPGAQGFLTFGFVVFNYGFVVHPEFFTGDMAGIVKGTLSGKLLRNDPVPQNDFVHDMNLEPWLGCDGPTAAGAIRLVNGTQSDSLDGLTRNTGAYTQQSKIYVTSSQVGCGDDSRYLVQWTVHRTSW